MRLGFLASEFVVVRAAMNEGAASTMLPFDALTFFDQHKSPFIFKMPKVVSEQKSKYESDELFRRLSRESEVRYTGFRDRPLEERQMRFQSACREGHTELAILATGTNLQLIFRHNNNNGYSGEIDGNEVDFDKEQGKVHIKSPFIMNGVCVRWRGWFDLERLDGVGCIEYDEERAQIEDSILREQLERYQQRLREFEEKQRAYRAQQERHAEAEVEVRSRLCRFPVVPGACNMAPPPTQTRHNMTRPHDQPPISANM